MADSTEAPVEAPQAPAASHALEAPQAEQAEAPQATQAEAPSAPEAAAESAPDSKSYQVYHTSEIFLINPQGRYVASLIPPFDISTISRRFIVLKKINVINSLP
jgi:hypothetical protein